MQKNQKGFTLIELLVVVGILGVLAAIAIPMYNNHRTSAFRASAKAALVQGAQNMERLFTRNNSYAAFAQGPLATDQVVLTTDGGRYGVAVVITGAGTGFTITATPVPAGADPVCGPLTINQAGLRTPAACW